MTQEEKQLLLKDLCARLPYNVVCDRLGRAYQLVDIDIKRCLVSLLKDEAYVPYSISRGDIVKPYLRPMSSMTEEEKKDILQSLNIKGDIDNEGNLMLGVECNIITLKVCKKYLEELNKRMFDVCHMIEKGLALEAPEGMYK